MMRRLLTIVMMTATLSAVAQQNMELTATVVAARMAPGWNLGNTMEAGNNANNFTNKGGLNAETYWQDTKTTQSVIDYVKAQGFRSIRIPCAWVMGHLSDEKFFVAMLVKSTHKHLPGLPACTFFVFILPILSLLRAPDG